MAIVHIGHKGVVAPDVSGRNLTEARQFLGVTVTLFGAMLGISDRANVSRSLNGRRGTSAVYLHRALHLMTLKAQAMQRREFDPEAPPFDPEDFARNADTYWERMGL